MTPPRLAALLAATLLAVATLTFASGVRADQMQGMDMSHAGHRTMQAQPTQGGQAAFAAIHEIVQMLAADPQTDWSKVNIEALRQHLIDMDNVTLRATVNSVDVPDGVEFRVTGTGATVGSIRRMATAHARTMNGVGGWTYTARDIPDGAALKVKVAQPAQIAEVKALSFIGVMALGSHHPMHHLMIATGQAMAHQ